MSLTPNPGFHPCWNIGMPKQGFAPFHQRPRKVGTTKFQGSGESGNLRGKLPYVKHFRASTAYRDFAFSIYTACLSPNRNSLVQRRKDAKRSETSLATLRLCLNLLAEHDRCWNKPFSAFDSPHSMLNKIIWTRTSPLSPGVKEISRPARQHPSKCYIKCKPNPACPQQYKPELRT